MKNLTIKENNFMVLVSKIFTENCGGKTVSDLISDNFSWFTIHNIQQISDLNKHQISGLIGSLSEKDLIVSDSDRRDLFCINEWFFINLVDDNNLDSEILLSELFQN